MKKLQFNQVKSQNFYTATTPYNATILKSYNTIVGYITQHGVLYRTRWSTTTSKQITQYYNTNHAFVKQNYVNKNELKDIIKAHEGFHIDTNYNGCLYNSIFVCEG